MRKYLDVSKTLFSRAAFISIATVALIAIIAIIANLIVIHVASFSTNLRIYSKLIKDNAVLIEGSNDDTVNELYAQGLISNDYSFSYDVVAGENSYTKINIFDLDYLTRLNYKVAKGKWFKEDMVDKNYCVISYNKSYKIGDTISLAVKGVDYEFYIIGMAGENQPLPNISTNVYNFATGLDDLLEANDEVITIVTANLGFEGIEKKCNIVIPIKLDDKLYQSLNGKETCFLKDLYDMSYNTYIETVKTFLPFLILSVLLFVCSIIIVSAIIINKNSGLLIINYAFGASRLNVSFMQIFYNMLLIAPALVIAFIVTRLIPYYQNTAKFTIGTVLVNIVFIALYFGVSVLAVSLKLKGFGIETIKRSQQNE